MNAEEIETFMNMKYKIHVAYTIFVVYYGNMCLFYDGLNISYNTSKSIRRKDK